MNIVLWIAQGLLAAAFVAAGATKLLRSREKPRHSLDWSQDFPQLVVKLIGTLEILAAVGLVVPAATDIAPVLTPVAASGLAVLMLGAFTTHARRGERRPLVLNTVFLALAVLVAWGRFGPYAF